MELMCMCPHMFDVALCSITVKNVAFSLFCCCCCLLYSYSANLGLLCMPYPGMGPLV